MHGVIRLPRADGCLHWCRARSRAGPRSSRRRQAARSTVNGSSRKRLSRERSASTALKLKVGCSDVIGRSADPRTTERSARRLTQGSLNRPTTLRSLPPTVERVSERKEHQDERTNARPPLCRLRHRLRRARPRRRDHRDDGRKDPQPHHLEHPGAGRSRGRQTSGHNRLDRRRTSNCSASVPFSRSPSGPAPSSAADCSARPPARPPPATPRSRSRRSPSWQRSPTGPDTAWASSSRPRS